MAEAQYIMTCAHNPMYFSLGTLYILLCIKVSLYILKILAKNCNSSVDSIKLMRLSSTFSVLGTVHIESVILPFQHLVLQWNTELSFSPETPSWQISELVYDLKPVGLQSTDKALYFPLSLIWENMIRILLVLKRIYFLKISPPLLPKFHQLVDLDNVICSCFVGF